MGCLSCISTTPNPSPEASHSTTNYFEKSGAVKARGLHIASLSLLKAFNALSDQLKEFFLNSAISGAAITP